MFTSVELKHIQDPDKPQKILCSIRISVQFKAPLYNSQGFQSQFIVFFFPPRLRVFCFKFVTYSYTVNFILACILISSALLAAEDPVREHSPRNEVLLPFAIFLSGIGWDGIG